MLKYKSQITIFMGIFIFICVNIPKVIANEHIDKLDNKKIYYFSWSEIRQVTANIGYSDFIDHRMSRTSWHDTISRNADGTSINIINRVNKRALVFKCDGSVKHFKLPSEESWLDNDNNILAWRRDDSAQYSGKYMNGPAPLSYEAMDPSGQYFIACFSKNYLAIDAYYAIASIDKPEIPLARVNVTDPEFLYIFLKEGKLYVFGYGVRDVLAPLKAFIYERHGEKFKLVEEFEIPRAEKYTSRYRVEDLSPWSDEILLMDMRPFPSLSKWYVYNLKTKELKYEGPAISNKGLFLQCDIIERVEEKKR